MFSNMLRYRYKSLFLCLDAKEFLLLDLLRTLLAFLLQGVYNGYVVRFSKVSFSALIGGGANKRNKRSLYNGFMVAYKDISKNI